MKETRWVRVSINRTGGLSASLSAIGQRFTELEQGINAVFGRDQWIWEFSDKHIIIILLCQEWTEKEAEVFNTLLVMGVLQSWELIGNASQKPHTHQVKDGVKQTRELSPPCSLGEMTRRCPV